MTQLEPTAAEIGEVMQEIAQTYRLRRTWESQSVAVEGLIPGVDAPGKVENGEFRPDLAPGASAPAYWRDAPWYLILTIEDLDRVILGKHGRILALQAAKVQIDADLKRQQDSLQRTVNYYADLLPECPADKLSRSITGPLSRGTYRIQPDRAAIFKLVDREAAAAAGLLRTVERMEPLPNGELGKIAAKQGWSLPGFEYQPQPPVSYTPAKGIELPDVPEMEPAIY